MGLVREHILQAINTFFSFIFEEEESRLPPPLCLKCLLNLIISSKNTVK